jgi:NAD-dependent deacetylase
MWYNGNMAGEETFPLLELLQLLQSSRYCTALTGAGVSTLSGIPDFRGGFPAELRRQFSPETLSLYSKVWFNTSLAPAQIPQRLQRFGIKPDGIINFLSNEPPLKLPQRLRYCRACPAEAHLAGLEDLVPEPESSGEPGSGESESSGGGSVSFLFPEEIFGLERFERDPSFFYKAAGPVVYSVHTKAPSVVHRVLAKLEKRGFLQAVITQNIDMLHQKAGSRRVIELHGSPRFHYCLRCAGIRMGYEEAAAALEAGKLPQCPRCGGVLKPALTFYGEPLPMEARRQAEEELYKTDLLLVLGTSLSVFPAADLPRAVLRRGGRIVIVNRQDTPLDENAFLVLRELEESFSGLERILNEV